MVDTVRFAIDWATEVGHLAAREPAPLEVASRATELSLGYNDPLNAHLLGHDEPISADEVIEHYAAMFDEGARMFLLYRDDHFVGDADLRGLRDGAAEFAFMIAAPTEQGKGLGTRFATMVHAFAFATLGLHHVYASIVPANTASRRVFDKLGYVVDTGPIARGYADHPDDIVMAIDRATFEQAHARALGEIRIAPR